MTKAKEALDEVLEETEEPEVAYGLAGGMTRRDVDDNERFRVMNTDTRTYSVLEEDEKADYEPVAPAARPGFSAQSEDESDQGASRDPSHVPPIGPFCRF